MNRVHLDPERGAVSSRRAWRHPLFAPLNQPESWDRLAGLVNPRWSFSESRATVVRIVDEAPDVKSLWLKPNARFGGFRPGQHVLLEIEIRGVRQGRCFSLSHAPRRDGLLRVTIKRKADGRVSGAAHALRAGEVVRISRAQGDFAARIPGSKLLMVCAGSGITPMVSLLHGLAATDPARDVVLVQAFRDVADALFADELRDLQARLPRLRVLGRITSAHGRLQAAELPALVADWDERETLLCGPDGYMQGLETMIADGARGATLQVESFGRRAAEIDPDAERHRVSLKNDERMFTVSAGASLLEGAEAAGLQPRFGCRRGICRTCSCRKVSGTVRNLLTGQLSGPGEELIQLCVSTPQSALELALPA